MESSPPERHPDTHGTAPALPETRARPQGATHTDRATPESVARSVSRARARRQPVSEALRRSSASISAKTSIGGGAFARKTHVR